MEKFEESLCGDKWLKVMLGLLAAPAGERHSDPLTHDVSLKEKLSVVLQKISKLRLEMCGVQFLAWTIVHLMFSFSQGCSIPLREARRGENSPRASASLRTARIPRPEPQVHPVQHGPPAEQSRGGLPVGSLSIILCSV